MPIDVKIMKYYFWEQWFLRHKVKEAQKNPFYEKAYDSLKSYSDDSNLAESTNLSQCTFTIFDLETTGFFPEAGDEIISIGAVKVKNLRVDYEDSFYTVIKPIRKVSRSIKELTGLEEQELTAGEFFPTVLEDFINYSKGTVLVAHPASFDINFLEKVMKVWRLPPITPEFIDSHGIANYLYPSKRNYLDELINRFHIIRRERHHALNDAQMTAEIFINLLEECQTKSNLELCYEQIKCISESK